MKLGDSRVAAKDLRCTITDAKGGYASMDKVIERIENKYWKIGSE